MNGYVPLHYSRKEKEREAAAFVDPYGHIKRQALFVLVECTYNYSKEKTTEMIVQSCCILHSYITKVYTCDGLMGT